MPVHYKNNRVEEPNKLHQNLPFGISLNKYEVTVERKNNLDSKAKEPPEEPDSPRVAIFLNQLWHSVATE